MPEQVRADLALLEVGQKDAVDAVAGLIYYFNGTLKTLQFGIGAGALTGQRDQMWLEWDSAAVAFLIVTLMLALAMMVT